MARPKKHPEHVNHERWLVSYADFVTLLFAFFVVMFAVSQVDGKKVGRLSEAFASAITWQVFKSEGAGLMPEKPTQKGNLGATTSKKRSEGDTRGHHGKNDLKSDLQRRLKGSAKFAGLGMTEVEKPTLMRGLREGSHPCEQAG